MKSLVIVESPTKAKTIQNYLGEEYLVRSSGGHTRKIPSESGAVNIAEGFTVAYQINKDSSKYLEQIITASRRSNDIYLATDPDREGEAISWHIIEILKEKGVVDENTKISRIAFHEITKNAVQSALLNPRELDLNLIRAQQAREMLDYLFGFTLSPILWRKLPGSKSAGRVQSVALELISEREIEIASFVSREYWTIDGFFGETTPLSLNSYNGKKLGKYDIPNEEEAAKIIVALQKCTFKVTDCNKKKVNRKPHPPFTTSTLLQESHSKLNFPANKTAKLAQKLYEGISIGGDPIGLITYMRTDSVAISQDATKEIESFIKDEYGVAYYPKQKRVFKNKAKNAQEAHEAIRPTDISIRPRNIASFLEKDLLALYELIWIRALVSQMADAVLEVATITVRSIDENSKEVGTFNGSASTVIFDGFYIVEKKRSQSEAEFQNISAFVPGMELKLLKVEKLQHFSKAPPRYSEASLVKKMEELGIGRPSTYPTIISVLQKRQYVKIENNSFVTEGRGLLVSAFLLEFFPNYVRYDFTADLENQLDQIASGKKEIKEVLGDFWTPFNSRSNEVLSLKNQDVLTQIQTNLARFLFTCESEQPVCPKCSKGNLLLKNSRYGSFIGCTIYPECDYSREITTPEDETTVVDNNKQLGVDPNSGLPITVNKGPYGFYLKLGSSKKQDTLPKGKTVSIPSCIVADALDLQTAMRLLELPKKLGIDQESDKKVSLGIGRYGPYVESNGVYVSVKKENFLDITLEEAILLIRKKKAKAKKEIES